MGRTRPNSGVGQEVRAVPPVEQEVTVVPWDQLVRRLGVCPLSTCPMTLTHATGLVPRPLIVLLACDRSLAH